MSLRTSRPVLWLLILFCLLPAVLTAQDNYIVDSMTRELMRARTDKDKLYRLEELVEFYITADTAKADEYAEQALQIAEFGRDRKQIINTHLRLGSSYLNSSATSGNGRIMKAMRDFQQAEREARESGFDDELAFSYLGLARGNVSLGQLEKALNYCNLALSIAGSSNNDSLKVSVHSRLGSTYQSRNENLLAARTLLDGVDIAELSKQPLLMRKAYFSLARFYMFLGEYDKALDQQMKMLAIDLQLGNQYAQLEDYYEIGSSFSWKKEEGLAMKMFELALSLADSLHYQYGKISSYGGITDMYFNNNDFIRGAQYFNSHAELTRFYRKAGWDYQVDGVEGTVYQLTGKYDSAYYFLRKAETETEKTNNPFARAQFYSRFADYYKAIKDYPLAIQYDEKIREIGKSVGDIKMLQQSAADLDSLYSRTGNFKAAFQYENEYALYSDSLRALAKATDVLKLEVDNDNRRRERLAREEEENTARRHNVQYMGLTAGLASLFILLGMLGFFVVHPGTIKALGFFTFIFFFEFLIMLLERQIHELTHGEPWKVLLIKIGLAAILLPLHHSLEHRVIHYLTHRKKISGNTLWSQLPFLRKKTADAADAAGLSSGARAVIGGGSNTSAGKGADPEGN